MVRGVDLTFPGPLYLSGGAYVERSSALRTLSHWPAVATANEGVKVFGSSGTTLQANMNSSYRAFIALMQGPMVADRVLVR